MEVRKARRPSPCPPLPPQTTPQARIIGQVQVPRPAGSWKLPDEITLHVLDFAADDPMARSKLRRVNRCFDRLVDDDSFWRTCMPLAGARLSAPTKPASVLAPVPPQPLAATLTASSQDPLHLTPGQHTDAACEFRTAIAGLPGRPELPGLHPPERDVFKALLTHAPGATERAQASIDQNKALKTNAAFMAAALQHDHVFLLCNFHLLAAAHGSAQFMCLEAALGHLDAGRLEEAEMALRTSVRRDPRLLTSRYLLGCTLRQQGKKDAALAVFADVIAIRPDYAEPHYLYGLILRGQKKHLEALRHFEKALALKPALSQARLCQGDTLLDLGRYEEALTALVEYRRADHTNPAAAAGEAWARYRLDDISQALDICNTFLQAYPDDIVVRLTRGNIYFSEYPVSIEALADYDAVLAAAPKSKRAQDQRRQLLDNRAALYRGLQACDAAILSGIDLAEAYFNRAILHFRYKNFSSALDDCSKAAAEHVSTKVLVLQATLCEELAYFEQAERFEILAMQAGEDAYAAACRAIWDEELGRQEHLTRVR